MRRNHESPVSNSRFVPGAVCQKCVLQNLSIARDAAVNASEITASSTKSVRVIHALNSSTVAYGAAIDCYFWRSRVAPPSATVAPTEGDAGSDAAVVPAT